MNRAHSKLQIGCDKEQLLVVEHDVGTRQDEAAQHAEQVVVWR